MKHINSSRPKNGGVAPGGGGDDRGTPGGDFISMVRGGHFEFPKTPESL